MTGCDEPRSCKETFREIQRKPLVLPALVVDRGMMNCLKQFNFHRYLENHPRNSTCNRVCDECQLIFFWKFSGRNEGITPHVFKEDNCRRIFGEVHQINCFGHQLNTN